MASNYSFIIRQKWFKISITCNKIFALALDISNLLG
jgi:hypothetical protein